jgi:hydrogenase expression/formation protein HypE
MGVEASKAEEILEAIRKTMVGKPRLLDRLLKISTWGTLLGGKRILEAPIADPVPRVC